MAGTVGRFHLGSLVTVPVSERPDLVAPSVVAALQSLTLADEVGVVEIDPALSDTAATQDAYGLDAVNLANCVIVTGKRDGAERTAACVILASTRADINTVVRRRLDVRKASFMDRERAVELSGMEFGGITPIGLPAQWPVLVDSAVASTPLVIVGSGIRRSKLILPGALFAVLPNSEIADGLGNSIG
jgi:prolyl-tRNA editing enzyme YbaK/EbsC (Cys-tRNA(Pro) deacylase)